MRNANVQLQMRTLKATASGGTSAHSQALHRLHQLPGLQACSLPATWLRPRAAAPPPAHTVGVKQCTGEVEAFLDVDTD
jgi:hypothetical protein